MQKKKVIILVLFSFLFFSKLFSQSEPVIAIDGVNNIFKSGLSLPYWLKAGQTIDLVANVKSISIVEFIGDSSSLKYSKVINLTTSQTVPNGKVWKMEALGIGTSGQVISGFSNSTLPSIFRSPKTYADSGNYTFIVPPGISNICIEVWGGGGDGSSGWWNGQTGYQGAGGGGGGYGYQCFTVTPGTIYNVIVGGIAGSSSVANLISATGGTNATVPNNIQVGIMNASIPGIGGYSNATYNISGISGEASQYPAGKGGDGANGGSGGLGSLCQSQYYYTEGYSGVAPGGGGGGGCGIGNGRGGKGAQGKIIIYW
jgi:hypothetical protein